MQKRAHHSPSSLPEKPSIEKMVTQVVEEARMVLPGIQALFGFQLIAVFNNRFTFLTPGEQGVHYAAILLTAIAIALIMTPAAYHRQAERGLASPFFVQMASFLIACAMVPLLSALTLEVYLLGVLILRSKLESTVIAVALFCLFAGLWFGFPWFERRSKGCARPEIQK
jgi:hypothetical protein